MRQAVAEQLYQLFEEYIFDDENLSYVQEKEIRNILNSKGWENGTEMEFFVQVKNSIKIPILLIKVEEDETKKIETYQIFCLESNKWEISNIDDIINFKTLLLISKIEDYNFVDIFTEKHLTDIRIMKLMTLVEQKEGELFVMEIGLDLLMRYPKSPKLRLMCSHFGLDDENRYHKTLYQVLHEKGRNDAIKFLLQNEYRFPKSEIAMGIPLVEKRLKSNIEFHKLLKDGKFEAIDKFLEANPNQQYIFNEDNESACWVAAEKMQNFELFSFLCKRGLTFTDKEIGDINGYEEFFQTKTYSGLDLTNKLQILESKTLTTNKIATDLSVNDIYKELRKIPSMNLILNILNKYRYIYIYIDYQENISRFSPNRLYDYYYDWDVYFTTENIFISGRGGTKQLLGYLALEFTYFAMNRLYKNFGNPYYYKDDKNQKRFNKIVQEIREKVSNGSIHEECIKAIFQHSERYWHSELITRVNYIFAFYGQDIGYQILQQQTPDLLQFYEIYVKPDLEKYLRGHFNHNYNLFNTKWHREMKECNKYAHEINNLWIFTNAAYSKNVTIQSDCVNFTCLKLFQNITRYKNSPLNIDNTYIIDLKTFSDNNYEIVSHLPQLELLILFDPLKTPFISSNISQYISKVAKRFIFIFDIEKNSSYQDLYKDNIESFADYFKPTNIDRKDAKLIFDIIKVVFQGRFQKLRELINFEEYLNMSPSFMSKEFLNDLFRKYSSANIESTSFFLTISYINRKFKTTICELDELRDEIVEKYVCENITGKSTENYFEIKTKNDKLVTFPGKTLRIKEDYNPVNEPMEISSENSKKVYNDMDNDIFIIRLKNSSKSFIIIDEEKEIEINNFSYADMHTFYENNRSFNMHWFVESDNSQHFYHHLKTFGSFDKTRSFCYRQKCTINEEDLLKKLQHQKVCVIAAPAGMGKTETINNMAANLIKNDSSMWTPVVVLRKRTEILKTFCPENSDPDYLFEFLTELIRFETIFEKEMFKVYFKRKANNVCLFLDGADENGPEFTDIIIELIKRLSQTNIKHIIVSTRLIGKFEFELKLDTIAIEMEPLSYDEKIECLENNWKYRAGLKKKRIQIARRVAKHVRDFDDFLNSPLQIKLVANICEDQLKEFKKNLINIYLYFKYVLSLTEMYNKFIENKVNITNNIANAHLVFTQHQLRYAAIRVLLNEDDVKLFLTPEDIELHINFITDVENWKKFEGIVDGIYSEKLHFVHRTYAEYYFADFLFNHCKVWNAKMEQFFFDHILVKKEFEYVRKFLNSYGILIDSPGIKDLSSRKPTLFQVPVTLHDAVVQNIEENNINILHYLHTLRFNITINPSSMITNYINNNSPNSIEKLIKTIKYLVTNCGDVHLSINELGKIKKILPRILLQDRIELIKALFQCKLIDLDELREDHQKQSFLSLWDEAKAKAVEDHENKDSKQLLPLFDNIMQMIDING